MSEYPELAGYKTLQIPIPVIYFDKEFNCRGVFAPQSCLELAESMRTKGLKIPIMVQPRADVPDLPDGYEYRVVAGHRRYTAAKYLLQWELIPATVMVGLSEEDARLLNLIENLERKNLSLIEEARALRKSFPEGTSFGKMADSLNKSEGWCRQRWKLLDLPEDVITLIEKGVITTSDLQLLIYKTSEEQAALATEIQAAKLHGLSTRSFARQQRRRLARSPKEINVMLTTLIAEGRFPSPYRALAWAAGRVSDEELLSDPDCLA
jgi:ParB family chromosome partitioning protein